MPSVLISGASRSLGLAMAKQYAEEGWRVHAGCRTPDEAEEAQALARRHGDDFRLTRLDALDLESCQGAAAATQDAIDLLILNAGLLGPWPQGLGQNLNEEAWQLVMDTNCLGVFRVIESFLPHLRRGRMKTIAVISSYAGSVRADIPGFYLYRPSKAAVNAAVHSLAIDLAPEGFMTVAVNPGWFRSRLGGQEAPIGPDESAAGIRTVLRHLTPADNGRFVAHTGPDLWF